MENLNIQGLSSLADGSQKGTFGIIQQLEQALKDDVQRLKILAQEGILTDKQVRYLAAQLVNKAQKINLCKKINFEQQTKTPEQIQEPSPVQNPLELFSKENPNFFEKEGRADILEYLKGLDVDKDEISKIAKLVEKLETSAVNSYLKQSAHDKSLNDENAAAKSKLISYSQNTPSGSNTGRIFTREDIGNMSGEEFTKNEKMIMEQVKQGLIK